MATAVNPHHDRLLLGPAQIRGPQIQVETVLALDFFGGETHRELEQHLAEPSHPLPVDHPPEEVVLVVIGLCADGRESSGVAGLFPVRHGLGRLPAQFAHRRRCIGNAFEDGHLAVGLERTLDLTAFDRYDRSRFGRGVSVYEQAERENE